MAFKPPRHVIMWPVGGRADYANLESFGACTFQFSLVDVGHVVRNWTSGALQDDIVGENARTPP